MKPITISVVLNLFYLVTKICVIISLAAISSMEPGNWKKYIPPYAAYFAEAIVITFIFVLILAFKIYMMMFSKSESLFVVTVVFTSGLASILAFISAVSMSVLVYAVRFMPEYADKPYAPRPGVVAAILFNFITGFLNLADLVVWNLFSLVPKPTQ